MVLPRRIAAVLILVPILVIPCQASANPFGFFGIESALKNDYLEDLGVRFIRGNILFSDTYSIASGEWSFREKDDKLRRVYARGGEMVVTFISPTNMDKIRAEYYRNFILLCVERYDGDADYGCTQSPPDCYLPGDQMYPFWSETERPAVKFWQMENEIDYTTMDMYWITHPGLYAEMTRLVYPLVKQSCPDCTVLLGSLFLQDMELPYFELLFSELLEFDVLDFHRFGLVSQNHFKDFESRINFLKYLKERYRGRRIWMTETSTYSDCPRKPDGTFLPWQSERQQARELLKLYVHFGSLGVEKIFWTFLHEQRDSSGVDNNFFWYTGLVYDGFGEVDKGAGVKKLAYFTYKLMVEKLGTADWTQISSSVLSNHVYQYRFLRKGRPVYVLWYDSFNGTAATKKVTLDATDVQTAQVKVTKAIPRFKAGAKADQVPFEEVFKSWSLPVTDGKTVALELKKDPVFVEEEGPLLGMDSKP